MGVIAVEKEGIHIIRTDEKGRVVGSTVTGDDVIISVPTIGYKKVVNILYDPINERLVVFYEDE